MGGYGEVRVRVREAAVLRYQAVTWWRLQGRGGTDARSSKEDEGQGEVGGAHHIAPGENYVGRESEEGRGGGSRSTTALYFG